jgi:RHS repeat-associated protein
MTTTRRTTLAVRLRTAALAVILAATGFLTSAVPGTMPAEPAGSSPFEGIVQIGNDLFAPKAALAAYCASNATFTGYLTASTSSHPAAARITDPDLYAWISNVDSTWSCTAYYRFDGVAWNTTASAGRFDWGLLITSDTVSCNYVVNSNDYVKGNATADCPDTDAEYALQATLTAERVYRQDVAHDDIGDLSFVHSDCASAYGGGDGEAITGGETGWTNPPEGFTGGNVDNRPGNNCDPLTLDGFGASPAQTITYDKTKPAPNFAAPAPGGPAVVPSAFYTVDFTPSDNVAGISAAGWSLQRQKATWTGSACGTFANDGSATTGTSTARQLVGQSLELNTCYQWVFSATDQNGNAGSTTSGSIRTDTSGVLGLQGHLRSESWDLGAGDSLAVSVGSGNVVISHPVVSLPIRGSSVSIGLTYNSHDSSNVGFGQGWRTNMDRHLESPTWGSDVTFTSGDGSRHRFTWVPATSSYARPPTLYATLAQQGSGFRLTYRDGSYDIFTAAGLLAEERDRFGNGVTLDRTVANQVSVVDAAGGRSIVIASSGGLVRSITDWAYVQDGIVQAGATGSRRMTCLYYAGSNLAGWTDAAFPYQQPGTCPASLPASSHATRLAYGNNRATEVAKTQTYETLVSGVLGTATRTVTTAIAYTGADVTSVTDAEGGVTGFTHPAADTTIRAVGQTQVVRPGTPASTTVYTLASPTDTLGRTTSVKRKLGSAWIEERTAYDATYPVEPASVTEDYGGTPSRTVTTSYLPATMGLVAKVVEPMTANAAEDQWTQFTYNPNNDVTQITVSQGSSTNDVVPLRRVTLTCWAASNATLPTDQRTCPTGTGLYPVRTVTRFVAGGAVDDDTNIATDSLFDASGQLLREIRHNHDGQGASLPDRVTGWTYDTRGTQTAEIRNYDNGAVSAGGTDLTTVVGYDTAGNRVSTADPRRAIGLAVPPSCALIATDYVTTSTVDALGNERTTTDPTTPPAASPCMPATPRSTSTEYDELGGAREHTDAKGLRSGTAFDAAGRAVATFEDPDGPGATAGYQTSETTVDAAGRPSESRDQAQLGSTGLGKTKTTYDELGRVTAVTEAFGTTVGVASTTATAYDALDRVTSTTVGDGTSTEQVTTTTYDQGGRAASVDDGFTCTTTSYAWDHADKVTTGLAGGTCARAASTHWREVAHAVDALGRETSVTQSDAWDDAGNGDQSSATTLDALGSVLDASSYTAATQTRTGSTFWVNPLGQAYRDERYSTVAGTRTPGSTARSTFDAAGNTGDTCFWKAGISVDVCRAAGNPPPNPPTTVTSTTSDARNQPVSRTTLSSDGLTLSGTTVYSADADYQPAAVYTPTKTSGGTVLAELQTTYTYETGGTVRRARLVAQTTRACVGPSPDHQTCSGGSTALGADTYEYDPNDNITKVAEDNGSGAVTHYYCHDGRNQLVTRRIGSDCSASPVDETYAYDAAGNIASADGGGLLTTYTYVQAPQPSSPLLMTAQAVSQTLSVSTDSAGLTTSVASSLGVTWSYRYDTENRMVSACRAASCSGTGFDRVDYGYDGAGHRTRITTTTAGGAVTVLDIAYAGDIPAQEKTNGAVTRTYVADDTGRIVRFCDPDCTGSNPGYVVSHNAHGDTLSIGRLDPATGGVTVANRFAYATWGTPTTTTANGYPDLGFRYLWVGAADVAWDNSAGQALYDMHARTYSPALGRFLQPDPARADGNLYAYAGNSPVTKSDPSGLDSWWRDWYTAYSRTYVIPDWIADLWIVSTGLACGLVTYKGKLGPAWFLATGACSWLASGGTPRKGDKLTYEVQINPREGIVRATYLRYERLSTGVHVLADRWTRYYGRTQRCVNYLTLKDGSLGTSRAPVSWYCMPSRL